MKVMIYLDANVFIYATLHMKQQAEGCVKILTDLVNGRIDACTSVLTWDEYFNSIRKNLGSAYAISESEKFINFLNLKFIDTNINTIVFAQQLIKKYNLRPRDAIHAATAIVNGCKEIASDDSDFDKVKELKRVKV